MADPLKIEDHLGRPVVLTESRLAHIRDRRSGLAGKLDLIAAAVAHPVVVTRARYIEHGENLYGRGQTIYVKVCVKYRPTPAGWQGEIFTAHFADLIDPGEERLWP